jgi:hypothetical protein
MLEALMTYVDTTTTQWTEVEPGYRRMTLVNDSDSGTRIVLLQYDAGYQLSYLDEHEHDEYLFVVSGTFVAQNQASTRARSSTTVPGRHIGPARRTAAPSWPWCGRSSQEGLAGPARRRVGRAAKYVPYAQKLVAGLQLSPAGRR